MNAKNIWFFGGFDPSGNAGLHVDQRTAEALNTSYSSFVTALTVQNMSECQEISPVDVGILQEQVESIASQNIPCIVKIGMIPNIEIVEFFEYAVGKYKLKCILDPIISTSSGRLVMTQPLIKALKLQLIPKTALITPNRQEAEQITGVKIEKQRDYIRSAKILLDMGCQSVLIKDGHGRGEWCIDYFANQERSFWIWTKRLSGKTPRGTGCCLSSAIAASWNELGSLAEAVIVGTAYVKRAIRLASPCLYHAPWPVESQDMPRVTGSLDKPPLKVSFPSVDSNFFGYYPIVPTADWIRKLVDWKVSTVQLRMKKVDNREIMNAIHATKGSATCLYVNDYWELAVRYRAHGVHLGQEDILKADIQKIQEKGLRLGVSSHSYEELGKALSYNPSYVALGPIFPTETKVMPWNPQGIERIRVWKSLSGIPLVAIGGMKRSHAKHAWQEGADMVSFVRELTHAKEPSEVINEWNNEVNKCRFLKQNTYDIKDKLIYRASPLKGKNYLKMQKY